MKLDSLTPEDERYLDSFSRRVRGYLESFNCGTDWRIRFVDVFPEKPEGVGWCSAHTRRMQFSLSLFDKPDAEVKRVVLHELTHAVVETHNLLPEGADPHGREFQAALAQLTEALSTDGFGGKAAREILTTPHSGRV